MSRKIKKRSAINRFNDLNEEIVHTKNQIKINKQKLRKIDKQSKEIEKSLYEENVLDKKFYTIKLGLWYKL